MRVRTSDGKIFEVSQATVRASRLLGDLAEAFEGGDELPDINMSNVTAANLAIISEFCEREEAHRLRANEEDTDQTHEEWKYTFLESMQDGVPSLMAAANFMHVEFVIEACSVNIAEFIKKRTPSEIREYFSLPRHSRRHSK